MNVETLIKELQKFDPKTEVIVSSDPEGNSYHKLTQIYTMQDLRFRIEDGQIDLIDVQDVEQGHVKQKDYDKAKSCIILYP